MKGTNSIKLMIVAAFASVAAASHAGFVTYTGIPGPYSAFAVGAFSQFDNYVSTVGSPTFQLSAMKFVGGVGQVGGTLKFEFFNSAAVLVNTANVTFGTVGDFIWTITMTPGFVVANQGFLQVSTVGNTTGRWYFTTTLPTVGSNSVAVGTGSGFTTQRNQAFELQAVPEPSSILAIGAGLAALVSRRRRK